MNNVRIEKSLELTDWICKSFVSLSLVADGRRELAMGCYYITWQHHAAVAHLCDLGLFAPATALMRCSWESYTRGLWLNHSATATQLENFEKSGIVPDSKKIAKAIDAAIPNMDDEFFEARKSKYSLLCDLNHTGIIQLNNLFVDGDITSEVDASSLDEILEFVESLALGALCSAALLAENKSVLTQAFDRMRKLKLKVIE